MDAKSNANSNSPNSIAIKTHLSPIFVTTWLCLACLSTAAFGQSSEPTWWNPTTWGSTSDTGVRKSSYFSNSTSESSGKSWLSMPQLPWSSARKKSSSSEPSLMAKMGQSTKRTWNNTVDFLNPFEDESQVEQQGYQPQNKTSKPGTGMFGWMWREETTETPTSVNEFLRQERPKF